MSPPGADADPETANAGPVTGDADGVDRGTVGADGADHGTVDDPAADAAVADAPAGPAVGEVRIQPYGERAFLVDVAGLDEVRALDAALRADPPPGTEDLVPAARTVLVRFAAGTPADDVEQHVRAVGRRALTGGGPAHDTRSPGGVVRLGVHYDGPDLDEVAALTGLTRAEVVARHTGRDHVVAFGGFMPGFAYLTGVDPALHVPRRSSPRERVPGGSVALAGEFTAVYPAATPGGWRLIGRSDAVLFDAARAQPALLVPGARVRFVDLDAEGVAEHPTDPRAPAPRGAP
ncbi:allophanate hydrolase subunit 1 [Cellulomonas cellasea]|uniref:Allophanate hydrolase subunit 1 n=1 Tax=Cellulomonas cellasea TaxID=43670 RepID=A0A7W4UEK9_9CELL|nr:allophanate hydrolase subunit 1 [Cellulomonas cellasea]MBB2922384.1 allophanate hydrolase subunit 1 [Cellulomonas cellasea]